MLSEGFDVIINSTSSGLSGQLPEVSDDYLSIRIVPFMTWFTVRELRYLINGH